MTLDIKKLKEVADDVTDKEFTWFVDCSSSVGGADARYFVKTITPSLVKEMIARIEELESILDKIEGDNLSRIYSNELPKV